MSRLLLLTRIARRNVWRNPKRSFLTLCAIALGIWSAVCISAFMRGLNQQMIEDSINNLTGHVQIHKGGYLDDPVIENSMPPLTEDYVRSLRGSSTVAGVAERVRVPAIVMSERESAGVVLVGIGSGEERGVSFIEDSISQGRSIDSNEDNGVVIGKALADKLQTDLGKRLVVMSENTENEVSDRGFRVVGVFDAKLDSTEQAYIFVARGTAQQMLGLGNNISEVAIRLTDDKYTDTEVETNRRFLPLELDVQPWQELEPLTVAVVRIQSGFLKLWYFIVCIAIAFGLVNTMFMAIFERTREIGMLRALGVSPRSVMSQITIESGFIMFWGLVFGNAIALGTVQLLSSGIDLSAFSDGLERYGFSKVVIPTVYGSDLFIANCVIFFVSLLSSIYPARRAARMTPLEALRGSA